MTFTDALAEQINELRDTLAVHLEHCPAQDCANRIRLESALLALACVGQAMMRSDEDEL